MLASAVGAAQECAFRRDQHIPYCVQKADYILMDFILNPDKVFCLGFHKIICHPTPGPPSVYNDSLGICLLDKHWKITTLPTSFSKEIPVTRSGDSCL